MGYRYRGESQWASCPNCGNYRLVNTTRGAGLCRECSARKSRSRCAELGCRSRDTSIAGFCAEHGADIPLTGGQWVLRGNVKVWFPNDVLAPSSRSKPLPDA